MLPHQWIQGKPYLNHTCSVPVLYIPHEEKLLTGKRTELVCLRYCASTGNIFFTAMSLSETPRFKSHRHRIYRQRNGKAWRNSHSSQRLSLCAYQFISYSTLSGYCNSLQVRSIFCNYSKIFGRKNSMSH